MTKAELQRMLAECREKKAALATENANLKAQIADLQLQLADCEGKEEPPTSPPPSPSVPYAADSPFNIPVDRTRVHPDSQKIVDRLLGFSSQWPTQAIVAGLTAGADWNDAVYYAKPTDPLVAVLPRPGYGNIPAGQTLKLPAGAKAPGGGDGSVVVVQPDGSEFGFWQCKIGPGTITGNGGYYAPPNSKGIHLPDACAAQFGLRAGHIEGQELAAGRIPHALIMVVDCTNGLSVEPSGPAKPAGSCQTRHGWTNAYAPALGQRFFLDMGDAEIEQTSVPPWQKTIMRCLAEYGAYVRDTGGGTFKTVSHESFASQNLTDPLVEFCRPYGGRLAWSYFDWRTKLRVSV